MKQIFLVKLLVLAVLAKSYSQEVVANENMEIMYQKLTQKEPKVLYVMNGQAQCGWAVSKGYHYKSNPEFWIVEEGDTIRFYNEKTKQKWLKKKDAKKSADMFWEHWHPSHQNN